MSLRSRRDPANAAPTASPTAAPVGAPNTGPGSRLHFVLSAGLPHQAPRSEPQAPIGMMSGYDVSDPPLPTARKIMMLKGLVFGIPKAKYEEAFAAAMNLIMAHGITTICWDGDKYTYPHPDTGEERAMGFTLLLELIHKAKPDIELMFFKKMGSKPKDNAGSLITGYKPCALRDMDKFGNVLGPFPFMSIDDTTIIKYDEAPSPYKAGANYGVEFDNIVEWFDLGLKGLQYIKDTLGVAHVEYMVFGLGGAVKKEIKEVGKNPSAYPTGVSEADIKIVQVDRA